MFSETIGLGKSISSIDPPAYTFSEAETEKEFSVSLIGFTKEEWLDVVRKTVPQKTIEINKKAFTLGYNYSC